MVDKQSNQHGGSRPGSGRKPKKTEVGSTKVLTAILNPLLEMIPGNRTKFINDAIMEKLVHDRKYKC